MSNINTSNIINWYQQRHPEWQLANNNNPTANDTQKVINDYKAHILMPIEQYFGLTTITYGFTSFELYKKVQKLSPQHTAPTLDQHTSHEVNSRGNLICKRGGLACDFIVEGFEENMGVIAKYIVQNLPFDRIYFYGNNKPLHVSISPNNSQFIQYMLPSPKTGLRYPGKRYNKDNYLTAEFKDER